MLCPDQDALIPVLEEAGQQGVQHMLCVAVSLERFQPMLELIGTHRQLSA
jgi:Tat protein secretion system quality control protein TatD with DNase activity